MEVSDYCQTEEVVAEILDIVLNHLMPVKEKIDELKDRV